MEWLASHWLLLGALGAALLGVARVVVKFTASPADDKVVEEVAEVLDPILPGDQKSKE